MENELVIRVKSELSQLDSVNAKFKVLQTAIKDADYQFRQNKISSEQLAQVLKTVDTQAKQLNLTYKQETDLIAQIYQVNQRAEVGFKSLGRSIDQTKQTIRDARQEKRMFRFAIMELMGAFDGLASVMGNSDKQTKSVITGTKTGIETMFGMKFALDMLGGIFEKISLPIGIAVGAFVALQSIIKSTKEELKDLNMEFLKAGRKFAEYNYGTQTEGVNVKSYSDARLARDLKYYSTQILFVDQRRKKEEELAAALKDKAEADENDQKALKVHEENVKNLTTQYKEYLDVLKAIGEEQARRRYSNVVRTANDWRSQASKEFMSQFNETDTYGMTPEGAEQYRYNVKYRTQFYARRRRGGLPLAGDTSLFEGYGSLDAWDKAKKEQFAIKEEMLKADTKSVDDTLREAMQVANSVFFDPMRAGIEAVITGSGRMADAVEQAAKRMAASLITSGIMSVILSLLGYGGVGTLFMQSIGLGKTIPTPVTGSSPSGKISSGTSLPGNAINNMRSSTPTLRIEVVGKYKGGDIYLAANDYISAQNAMRQ